MLRNASVWRGCANLMILSTSPVAVASAATNLVLATSTATMHPTVSSCTIVIEIEPLDIRRAVRTLLLHPG